MLTTRRDCFGLCVCVCVCVCVCMHVVCCMLTTRRDCLGPYVVFCVCVYTWSMVYVDHAQGLRLGLTQWVQVSTDSEITEKLKFEFVHSHTSRAGQPPPYPLPYPLL